MSAGQPPPYEAQPEPYKGPPPPGYGGAYPYSGQYQAQHGLAAGQQAHPGAQPYPPGTQPYPPGTQPYPPGAQPYPYPPGAQPYPQYPVNMQPQPVGVHFTAGPTPTATFVNTTVVTMLPIPCGPNPVQAVCPGCHATVLTSTSHETGLLTWIIFAVLFFLGFWLCCFIPFCVNDCKDVIHRCPNCRVVIGKYSRM